MLAYEHSENLVTKNEKGNLNGYIRCHICEKDYFWEDNVNAQAIVREINIDGNKIFIALDIFSKCPHCNYKTKFIKYERNDSIRY